MEGYIMKKLITGILITVFVFSLGTVCIYAFSQTPDNDTGSYETTAVSDNTFGTAATAQSTESTAAAPAAFTDTASQATVRTSQKSVSQCPYYTDKNHDGVCDHCVSQKQQASSGRCQYYTDQNGDGICDHCTSQKKQTNSHHNTSRHHHSGEGCHR